MGSFKHKGASARRQSASPRERFLTLERYVQMAGLDADAALKRSERLRRASSALDEILNTLLKVSSVKSVARAEEPVESEKLVEAVATVAWYAW